MDTYQLACELADAAGHRNAHIPVDETWVKVAAKVKKMAAEGKIGQPAPANQ